MQPAVGAQKHYLYEVTVTFHKLLLAISFPCEVTASLKRAHRKYPLKSNHMLDNQKFKCDFANSKITYQAVFSMEANSNPPFDFIPDTATVSLMLVTPKGNKSAGQFEIVPTNFLRETLDPQELKDVKSAVEKCPDKKAGIVYSLNVRRLKLLTPEEYKAEMAKNPDVTMEGGDASYMSQLGPSSSSFSRGGGTAVNTSSTAINSTNKILTSDIRLDGNAKISANPGSIPVPQPIGRPQIPMPIPVSQNRQPTQAPPVDQSRNLVPPPTQASNDTSREEPNSTRSGSKSRSKGNVTLSFERKPPTLAPSPGNPSAPQQVPPPVTAQPQTSYPQPVVQTPQTTHTPSQPDHRSNPTNHRPIEVTPFQTNGSAVNDHRTGTVESTKTQAVVSSEHRGTDVSGNAALETAQLRAQVVQLKAQLEENGIKYQRDVGGLQKERTDLKAQMDKLYDERGQWNNTKRELLLKSDEVVSLKEQLLQLQGKHSGPHPDSVRLAQTLATLSAVQKDNDKLTRDIQQLEDDRRASKQTIQTLQERLKEQATAQSQREGSLAASYTTKIAALESQVSSLQSSLSTVSAEKTAVAAQLSSLLSDKQSSSQHSQSLVSSLQHRVNELQSENEQLHTRILRLEDEKGDLEEKLLGRDEDTDRKIGENVLLQERQKEVLVLSREIADLKEGGARDQLEKQRLQEKIKELTGVIQTQQSIQRQELAGKEESFARVEQELETKEKTILDLQKQLADTKRNISKLEGTIANMQQQQQNSGATSAKEMEAEWNRRASELKEQYEGTMKELRAKLLDYKERLKAEEQKNAQSNNDFGFEDDQTQLLGQLQLEKESLTKQNRLLEAKDEERREEIDKIQQEYMRLKRSTEGSSKELAEAKSQIVELKSAYLKLEVVTETLKKGSEGGLSEKVSAATVKRFDELERKYVQAKRNIGDALNLFQTFRMKQAQLEQLTMTLLKE